MKTRKPSKGLFSKAASDPFLTRKPVGLEVFHHPLPVDGVLVGHVGLGGLALGV